METVKLANVLLEAEDYLAEAPELLFIKHEGARCSYDRRSQALKLSGLVDFTTYLNALSVAKWVAYTAIDQVKLHIEVAGDGCVIATRSLFRTESGNFASEVPQAYELAASQEFESHDITMPLACTVAGFSVMTEGDVEIRNAYYYTEVAAERVQPTSIALCTTTFRKEDYIVPNIERIREGVLGCGDAIAHNFKMFVVDNGRTLDAEALSGDGVQIIPNPNVGGSGGFARGMIAAQDDPAVFTHVVLMDDDVRMLTESFKRLYALLSLRTEEYRNACVNGAMLQLENPVMQFEDVSYVRRIGGYQKIKHCMAMDDQENLVENELIDVEVPGAYGAWWFSCIPMELVEREGLPLPFFIRCDDVEYGVRCQTKYMTMNGICVWHEQFVGRFNAAVVCYQYARNIMVTNALHGCCDERMLLLQFWRTFRYYLRTMDYGSAELWLDGFADYLKGPSLLMEADGSALMKENSAKGEKLLPLDQLDPAVVGVLKFDPDWLTGDSDNTPLWYKVALTIPHDRHYLPDGLLSDKPGVLTQGAGDNFTPWQQSARRKTLVALSPDGKLGAIRRLDRERYQQLVDRYRNLMREYARHGGEVAQAYRDAQPQMTSKDFWMGYLESLA